MCPDTNITDSSWNCMKSSLNLGNPTSTDDLWLDFGGVWNLWSWSAPRNCAQMVWFYLTALQFQRTAVVHPSLEVEYSPVYFIKSSHHNFEAIFSWFPDFFFSFFQTVLFLCFCHLCWHLRTFPLAHSGKRVWSVNSRRTVVSVRLLWESVSLWCSFWPSVITQTPTSPHIWRCLCVNRARWVSDN